MELVSIPKTISGAGSSRAVYRASFDSIYADGDYGDAPFYSEAVKAFYSTCTNQPRYSGPDTFHEQLLAGNITPDDMKTIGYSNIRIVKSQKRHILDLMVNSGVSASEIREYIEIAKRSNIHNVRICLAGGTFTPPVKAQTSFIYVLMVTRQIPVEVASKLSNHMGLFCLVQFNLKALKEEGKQQEANSLAVYVDEFLNALISINVGDDRQPWFYSSDQYPLTYKGDDFIRLIEAQIPPVTAANGMKQQLSVERLLSAGAANVELLAGAL